MIKLKACPFCGEQPETSKDYFGSEELLAFCRNCGTGGKLFTYSEWNNRPVECELSHQRDEARTIARKLYAENKRLKAYIEFDRQQRITDGRSR